MMDKKRWLWKRKSSEKSSGETESSGSMSSHSEKYSDEQEASKESPSGSNQSPEVTSNVVSFTEDVNNGSFINELVSEKVTSNPLPTTTGITNDGSLEKDKNGETENIETLCEGDLNDGLRNMSDKLSAAIVNVNAKEDLVQQHAKVAEEAIAGWEKAENEVAILKKQLDAVTLKKSALEDRVTHLDGALKECVRQLRQTREEQEENIHAAVVERTRELESVKTKLESKLIELQSKLDASNAKSSIDLDMHHKIERLEKENMALRHDLLVQSEELEIKTIERDLSTQAAETASKQHLESIKKVAKLEAECRRMKSVASRASVVNDHKSMTSSSSSSAKIDLMDDFLEMERLVALPETKNESFVANHCSNEESSLRGEFDIMNQQMDELKEKLEKVEAEKTELEIALRKSEEYFEESQLQLREAEQKLEELHKELENAYKSKQMMEKYLINMETEAQTLSAKVDVLEAEVDSERVMSAEIAMKCRDLEEELERKYAKVESLEAEVNKERTLSKEIVIKCKELAEELESKSAMVDKEKMALEEIAIKCKELEEEVECKSAKIDFLESEVEKEKMASEEIAIKYKELEEELESKSAKVELLESEVDKEKTLSKEIAMKCKELEEEMILRSTTASSYGEKMIKQEELALAAGKLAECQKTIASLGNQLKSLATLEDFLIDTASIPPSPSVVARAGGETWKLHSNDTFSPKRDSNSSRLLSPSFNKIELSSPPSSSSSTSSAVLPNQVSSEKGRNGFAKFFSRTKSGIRLEI